MHVTWPNDRAAPEHLRVELVNVAGVHAGVAAYTDSEGRASMQVNQNGTFRLKISGIGIEDTLSDTFSIRPLEGAHHEYVQVKPRENASQNGPGGAVTLSDLKVPESARKEFNKGLEASGDKNWTEAIKHFQKAVSAYPQYDLAFNNLGVAYMNVGDSDNARGAFEKAMSANAKNGSAHCNLARLLLRQKKYDEALAVLKKAQEAEPSNPETMVMLATVYLSTERWNEALTSARKVHELSHERWAVAHVIAARALEQLNQQDEAALEYRVYLKEFPNSPNAEQVKQALARLDSH